MSENYYKYIINPKNKRMILSDTNIGKSILRNYIFYNNGGKNFIKSYMVGGADSQAVVDEKEPWLEIQKYFYDKLFNCHDPLSIPKNYHRNLAYQPIRERATMWIGNGAIGRLPLQDLEGVYEKWSSAIGELSLRANILFTKLSTYPNSPYKVYSSPNIYLSGGGERGGDHVVTHPNNNPVSWLNLVDGSEQCCDIIILPGESGDDVTIKELFVLEKLKTEYETDDADTQTIKLINTLIHRLKVENSDNKERAAGLETDEIGVLASRRMETHGESLGEDAEIEEIKYLLSHGFDQENTLYTRLITGAGVSSTKKTCASPEKIPRLKSYIYTKGVYSKLPTKTEAAAIRLAAAAPGSVSKEPIYIFKTGIPGHYMVIIYNLIEHTAHVFDSGGSWTKPKWNLRTGEPINRTTRNDPCSELEISPDAMCLDEWEKKYFENYIRDIIEKRRESGFQPKKKSRESAANKERKEYEYRLEDKILCDTCHILFRPWNKTLSEDVKVSFINDEQLQGSEHDSHCQTWIWYYVYLRYLDPRFENTKHVIDYLGGKAKKNNYILYEQIKNFRDFLLSYGVPNEYATQTENIYPVIHTFENILDPPEEEEDDSSDEEEEEDGTSDGEQEEEEDGASDGEEEEEDDRSDEEERTLSLDDVSTYTTRLEKAMEEYNNIVTLRAVGPPTP